MQCVADLANDGDAPSETLVLLPTDTPISLEQIQQHASQVPTTTSPHLGSDSPTGCKKLNSQSCLYCLPILQ